MFPGCSGQRGEQFLPQVVALLSVLISALRFCGLIQALVKSPDSGAPAEETEGVGEVLEVRRWVQGA